MGTDKLTDIRYYFQIIKFHLWIILAVVIITALVTATFSVFYLKPIYQASTKLIVNKAQESNNYQQLDLNMITSNIKLIDTYKEIIKTPAIMEVVAKKYPQYNLTPEQLIAKVKVSAVNETQVMTVSITDYDPKKAVRLVNSISEVFRDEIPTIMKVDNVSLLHPAKIKKNPQPVSTSPFFNTVVSMILSFLVVYLILLVRDLLDDTIKSESDIEKHLGIPVLTIVPRTKSQDFQSKRQSQRREIGETSHV